MSDDDGQLLWIDWADGSARWAPVTAAQVDAVLAFARDLLGREPDTIT